LERFGAKKNKKIIFWGTSNLSFSANKKSNPTGLLFLLLMLVDANESNRKQA
jgi:hypothetical protein